MNKQKKIMRLVLYPTTALGVGYKLVSSIFNKRTIKLTKQNNNSIENKEGYSDINSVVDRNNFVILHIKRDDDISSLREKFEFCEKNDISVGIVLDTKKLDLITMYEDIDFLQAVVKEYKIDLPIYCNIVYIMSSEKLSNVERTEIMQAFIDKASISNMYFGFYGTDTNLVDCDKYILKLKEYDCYVVKDSEDLKYSGMCTIKKDLDGKISASSDLSKIILDRDFNNSEKLVFSSKYVAKQGDTYHSLALKYGLSEEELRKYNDNAKKELKYGELVIIPNLYKTQNNKVIENDYKYAIARGIDISNYQNKIEWDQVKKTSDFVIVEVSRDPSNYQLNKGTYIKECTMQIKNTIENNIELGLYFCICKDMKISEYEKRLETYLTTLDSELEKNNIILDRENVPMFLDFEIFYQYNDYYRLMKTFENLCNRHGFKKIGIYGNASTLKQISSSLSDGEKHIELNDTAWFVWQSGGSQYSSHENTDKGYKLSELVEPKQNTNSQYTTHIRQVTNVCKDTGAANDAGNCDVNFCYSELVFGTSFGKNNDESGLVEYMTVDLNQYKNISTKNIITPVINALIALEVVIVAVDIIGNKLILKIKKSKKQKNINKKGIS